MSESNPSESKIPSEPATSSTEEIKLDLKSLTELLIMVGIKMEESKIKSEETINRCGRIVRIISRALSEGQMSLYQDPRLNGCYQDLMNKIRDDYHDDKAYSINLNEYMAKYSRRKVMQFLVRINMITLGDLNIVGMETLCSYADCFKD
jgi:hypothetical protein